MAAKDFDAERSQNGKAAETFVVGGETFTIRRFVPADVLAAFGRREVKNFADTMEVYDEFVKACIEDKDGAKWDKVRREAEPPLTVGAVEQVLWWVMDQAAGRPTEASSSSRRGRAAQPAT